MNSTRTPRSWGLARLLALSLPAFAATAALAQNAPGSTDETVKLEKFVVTGSSIPTPEGETFSPVTIFSPNEMARMGAAMPIEVLRQLPGYTGAAGVNLRGLAGTLSLLDGKRTASFGDFNLLPLVAIERIEVVKDGAGAIYGSDALSGVFNTELVKRYEGSKVDFYYGNTTDKDAGVMRGGFITGHTAGKFNVVLAAEYYERNALHSNDRFPSSNADTRALGGKNGGSPTFSGRTTARIGSATNPVQALMLRSGVSIPMTSADYVVFDTSATTSNQFLNFREYTPSIPAQDRTNFYGRVNWQITDQIDGYVRLLYATSIFDSGLAPSPMPGTGAGGTALRNATRLSPHIPVGLFIGGTAADVDNVGTQVGTTAFRTIAMGPRRQVFDRDAWDLAAGLHGRFGQDWNWNLNYVYGWFYRVQEQSGAPGRTALVARIMDGRYNPFALDTASGTGPGGAFNNPQALAESAASGKTYLKAPTRGFDFSMNGTAFTLPTGDVKLGFGADYYRNDQSTIPEAIFFTGDLLGLNAANPSVSRAYGMGAFAELVVPLANPEMKIPFVKKASINLQGRYDYQTVEGYAGGNTGAEIGSSFTAHTPKLGLQWQPVDEILIRGTWGTGFRLPTLTQLFGAAGTSNPQLRDPLGFPIPNQTQITTGGNPNLSPEEAKTYSFGFVYSPKAVPGLSLVIDYYYGAITGLVGEGSQFIVNTNAAGQGSGFVAGNPATINPNAPFANLITRSSTGSITTVASSQFNISARETTGLDWAVTYVWPNRDLGKFTTRLEWNTALSWDLTPVAGAAPVSYLGVYLDVSNNAISPGSIPKHKGFLTQVWEKGNWAASLTGNYISKLQDDPNFSTVTGTIRYVDSWVTWDGQVSYEFKGGEGWRKWLDETVVRVGASNLLDEDAPFAAGAFNDSYDVTTHNNKGRFVYMQLTKKF
jgi:iron complex outermembrane receptor protein